MQFKRYDYVVFFQWRSRIRAFMHPFGTIARELQIIRELYELELAAHTDHQGRPDPIRRVTEAPSKNDTEVTYAGVDQPKVVDIFEDQEDWE